MASAPLKRARHSCTRLKKAAPTIGQISTDGWQSYIGLIDLLWGNDINYGQIIKIIGHSGIATTRYSPGAIKEVRRKAVIDTPKINRICTSYVERMNLSIRMGNRRMTRLTNAFSKKWANHEAMLALGFAYYNFCRPHQTLTKQADGVKTTPAMKAGLEDHVWTLAELVERSTQS